MDESNTFLSPQGFPPNTIYRYFREIYLANVCCVHSLESPRRGDSNEYTQHTFILYRTPKRYPTIISIMPLGMALIVTLRSSNYRCLEQIFMVPKGFEPSKFDCISSETKVYFRITPLPLLAVGITAVYILLTSVRWIYFTPL